MDSFIIKKLKRVKSSIYFLLVANIITLIGVVFLEWDIIHILYLYWLESCIIGFYNLLKIVSVKVELNFQKVYLKIFGILFFSIHYTAMMALLMVAGINLIATLVFNRPLSAELAIKHTWSAFLSLFISHGYSFYKNHIKGKEREKVKLVKLMYQPYVRIIVMWIVLMGGVFLILKLKEPVFLIVILVLIKIAADVFAHVRERKRFS